MPGFSSWALGSHLPTDFPAHSLHSFFPLAPSHRIVCTLLLARISATQSIDTRLIAPPFFRPPQRSSSLPPSGSTRWYSIRSETQPDPSYRERLPPEQSRDQTLGPRFIVDLMALCVSPSPHLRWRLDRVWRSESRSTCQKHRSGQAFASLEQFPQPSHLISRTRFQRPE